MKTEYLQNGTGRDLNQSVNWIIQKVKDEKINSDPGIGSFCKNFINTLFTVLASLVLRNDISIRLEMAALNMAERHSGTN